VNYFKYLFALLLLSASCAAVYGQPVHPDSLAYRASIDSLKILYLKETGSNSLLYNGSEYSRPPVSTKGFPFFEWDIAVEGSVFYDGVLYQRVNMQYDIAKDELAMDNFLHTNVMRLVSEKISWFTLQQHRFVYFPPGKNTTGQLAAGFYEQLFSGKITVLAKRQKIFRQSLNAEDNASAYNMYNYYFLKKDDQYYAVSDKHDVLAVLKDRKDLLEKYIRTNRLRVNKNFEESLVKIAAYYSGLNQ
jgi:hypothetical protein